MSFCFLKLTYAPALFKLAAPITCKALVETVGQFITLAFVGHIDGPEYMGGATLGGMMCNISGFSLAYGMCSALDALISQAFGAKEYLQMGRYAQRAIVIVSLMCCPVALLWTQTSRVLTAVLGIEERVAELAGHWAKVLIIGLWPRMMCEILRSFLQGQNIVWPVVVTSVAQTTSILLCNIVLVKYYSVGFLGPAYAMIMSQWIAFVLLVSLIILRKKRKKLIFNLLTARLQQQGNDTDSGSGAGVGPAAGGAYSRLHTSEQQELEQGEYNSSANIVNVSSVTQSLENIINRPRRGSSGSFYVPGVDGIGLEMGIPTILSPHLLAISSARGSSGASASNTDSHTDSHTDTHTAGGAINSSAILPVSLVGVNYANNNNNNPLQALKEMEMQNLNFEQKQGLLQQQQQECFAEQVGEEEEKKKIAHVPHPSSLLTMHSMSTDHVDVIFSSNSTATTAAFDSGSGGGGGSSSGTNIVLPHERTTILTTANSTTTTTTTSGGGEGAGVGVVGEGIDSRNSSKNINDDDSDDPENNWPEVRMGAIFQDWGVYMQLAVPGACSLFIEWGSFELAASIAGRLGTVPLAVHGIYSSMAGFFYMIPLGIASATSTIAGNMLGAGMVNEAKEVMKLGIAFDFTVGLISALFILLIARPYVGSLYSSDEAVQKLVFNAMFMFCVYVVVDASKCITLNLLRSIGLPTVTVVVNTLSCVFVMLPVGWYCGVQLNYGLAGLWAGMSMAWLVATCMFSYVCATTDWEKLSILARERYKKSNDDRIHVRDDDDDHHHGHGTRSANHIPAANDGHICDELPLLSPSSLVAAAAITTSTTTTTPSSSEYTA